MERASQSWWRSEGGNLSGNKNPSLRFAGCQNLHWQIVWGKQSKSVDFRGDRCSRWMPGADLPYLILGAFGGRADFFLGHVSQLKRTWQASRFRAMQEVSYTYSNSLVIFQIFYLIFICCLHRFWNHADPMPTISSKNFDPDSASPRSKYRHGFRSCQVAKRMYLWVQTTDLGMIESREAFIYVQAHWLKKKS